MVNSENQRSGLGDALVNLRFQLGLSRKDLAQMTSLSYPYISELEKGKKQPSAKAFAALAAVLEVTPAELQQYAAAAPTSTPSAPARLGASPTPNPVSPSGASEDLAERLTAAVLAEIEPVVLAVVRRTLQGGSHG